MKVLLLGSGGREHALAWKLAQSPKLTKLYAAPGNPGIAEHAELVPIDPAHPHAVLAFARDMDIGLVVIGPEAPLVAGVGDLLRENGVLVFGPDAAAAQLEGSKGFTKDLCARENIPTAAYARFTDADAARAGLARFGLPVVIKADGLAAGKGVVIAEDAAAAEAAIADMFDGGFGEAGAEVVIEEFLTGEEASFFALTDGKAVVPFGSAQDHKRVGEGDTGPNTGGMGAYSPARVLTPALEARAMAEIVEPTVRAMAAAGTPYSGVLYAGLMLTAEGPKLIEYNARFGDPECQVLMMRLEGDLLELMLRVAEGRLGETAPPRLSDAVALTVVMAANGYPGTPEKGGTIEGIDAAEAGGAKVFHAGTAIRDGGIVANGGRVLNVTATGRTVAEAQAAAYRAVDAIRFPTGFCRRDIGWREVARERQGQ
ncbi:MULTISPECIES: phosphoribosylamine--glycine ligase [Sphingomonas]|uniref:Phosphoribosylamine--glycine ligase n=1 Tax=Edaphosphingomonas fennica TaxID=114404 RepID=A0A2T4I2P6_9SPHN|nr:MULTISPECIES: phosphoribosylamine--glycine ligase [Sphingomonas]MDX3885660.1 phosphoribosylamine--glycine ligase [Sphingomonas sp.]PTD23399.1 phosphoribosylamine--glycine ligase [Sphingomonas fennica]